MKVVKTLIKVLILIFLLASFLHTQEGKKEEKKKQKEYAHDHQEVVVTAKKEIITEVANIKEITTNEIETGSASNPVQAIETIPGVFYTIGSRGETILQLRGFSQRQILTMVDGIPIYLPFDGQVDLSQFPLEGLAKIKVIKGTSSTVYGSNGMGGIVNLITQVPTEKTSARLSLNLGSTVNQRYAISLGKKWERIGFWISGEYKKSDGFSLPKNFKPQPNEDGNQRQNSDFTNKGMNGRLYYSWEKGSLFFGFSLVDSKRGIPPHIYEDRPRYWRFTSWRKSDGKLSFRHTSYPGIEFKGSVYFDLYSNILDSYDDSTYTTQEKNYAFHSTFDDYSLGANLFGDYSRGIHHLRFGAHIKEDTHRSQGDYNEPWEQYEAANYSLGLEDELNLSKHISLIIGTSFDWLTPLYANGQHLRPSVFHLSPLFGVVSNMKSSQIYCSVARKSRFPTLKEFYSEYTGRNIPNPYLKEESVVNIEAGFRTFLPQNTNLELSLFYADLKDLIVRKRVGTLFQMQNIDRARYLGAEFSLCLKMKEEFDARIDYSYLHARNTSAEKTSSLFEYKPAHKASLVFNFRLPLSLEGMLKALYIDKRYFEDLSGVFRTLPPYTLVDIKIFKRLGNAELFFLLKNLFDSIYEFESGFPGPGREFLFGITWKTQ